MLTHRDRTLNSVKQLNSVLVAHNRRVALQEFMRCCTVAFVVGVVVVAVIIVGAATVR